MELHEFTKLLWRQINAEILGRHVSHQRRAPDVILVSFDRLREMYTAIGEMSVYYNSERDMLKFRGIRILPDPTKSNDDFEILYNTNK